MEYHRRASVIDNLDSPAIAELLDFLNTLDYPKNETRKYVRKKQPEKTRGPSAKSVIRKKLQEYLESRNWEVEKPLYLKGNPPGSKLHFIRDRVGIVWAMGNRITIGTDILRLERAYHPAQSLIDIGVLICPTSDFEDYYFGIDGSSTENLITFEELLQYMEMMGELFYIPVLIVGIDSPRARKKKIINDCDE